MGIADEMKRLSEDIVVSHDMRVKAIGEIVGDTRKTLKGFEVDRKKMSKEQAKNLADFVKGLEKNVGNMLTEFQKNHKEMSKEQAKALADFAADLTKDVGNLIAGIQKDHKEMADKLKADADKLRADLAKGEKDRLETFKFMMTEIQKGVEEIETYVRNKLKEFSDDHAQMSEEMRKELSGYVDDMVSSVKKLLGEYSADMKKAKANWQNMTTTIAKKRGISPKVGVAVKAKFVKEVIDETLPVEDRVLKFIERYPEGVKVGDMEEPLEVPRMKLGVIAKKLLEEGKLRKEDNLYFPL